MLDHLILILSPAPTPKGRRLGSPRNGSSSPYRLVFRAFQLAQGRTARVRTKIASLLLRRQPITPPLLLRGLAIAEIVHRWAESGMSPHRATRRPGLLGPYPSHSRRGFCMSSRSLSTGLMEAEGCRGEVSKVGRGGLRRVRRGHHCLQGRSLPSFSRRDRSGTGSGRPPTKHATVQSRRYPHRAGRKLRRISPSAKKGKCGQRWKTRPWTRNPDSHRLLAYRRRANGYWHHQSKSSPKSNSKDSQVSCRWPSAMPRRRLARRHWQSAALPADDAGAELLPEDRYAARFLPPRLGLRGLRLLQLAPRRISAASRPRHHPLTAKHCRRVPRRKL